MGRITISMPDEMIQKIDHLKGDVARSKFIQKLLRKVLDTGEMK